MTAIAAFRPHARWPRRETDGGIAGGWQGWAWVWTVLCRAGLIEADARTLGAIHARLEGSLASPRRPAGGGVSPFSGFGAVCVVAAQATHLDPRFSSLLEALLAKWGRLCRGADSPDLMTGAAGALLAMAEVEACVPGSIPPHSAKRLVDRLQDDLSRALSGRGVPPRLGLAHGVAGELLALETAAPLLRTKAPSSLRRLALDLLWRERLAGSGGAAAWPVTSGGTEVSIHGWCHGGPGIALACLVGSRLDDDPAYRSIAVAALKGSAKYATPAESFCCGRAGRAHILLEAYRLTGRARWLGEARRLARRPLPAQAPDIRNGSLSLHRGALGWEYLRWRLAYPKRLPLPGLGSFSCL